MYIKVIRWAVFKAMYETAVLVFTQAAGLVDVFLHEKMAKIHTCMTVKDTMDFHVDHPCVLPSQTLVELT